MTAGHYVLKYQLSRWYFCIPPIPKKCIQLLFMILQIEPFVKNKKRYI